MRTRTTGLIVALDQPDLDQSESLANKLAPHNVAFKVGLTLFCAHGPQAVRRIAQYGKVFCDLKLHDIPQQVAGAAVQASRSGVWMLSVHASGGAPMLRKAVQALGALPDPPILAAVTVLTSLSTDDLSDLGLGETEEQVLRLARLAAGAGAGAVICSPHELGILRRVLGPEVLLVSPGIRPAGSPAADQARITTPAVAARAGADYIVVGRPITDAKQPVHATRAVLEELQYARN